MNGQAGVEPPPGVPFGCPLYLLSDSSLKLYPPSSKGAGVPIHGGLGNEPMFWRPDASRTSVQGHTWSSATTADLARHLVEGAESGVQCLHLFCFFNELIAGNGQYRGGHTVDFESTWLNFLGIMKAVSPRPFLVCGADEATWKYEPGAYDQFVNHAVELAHGQGIPCLTGARQWRNLEMKDQFHMTKSQANRETMYLMIQAMCTLTWLLLPSEA